jgi:hypothetical protein
MGGEEIVSIRPNSARPTEAAVTRLAESMKLAHRLRRQAWAVGTPSDWLVASVPEVEHCEAWGVR